MIKKNFGESNCGRTMMDCVVKLEESMVKDMKTIVKVEGKLWK